MNRDWVHMNTVPFHTLARLTGAILGLGLGLRTTRYVSPIRTKHPIEVKVLAATLALMMYNYMESIRLPIENLELFYILAFLKNLMLPYVTVAFIPYLSLYVVRRLHMFHPVQNIKYKLENGKFFKKEMEKQKNM